MPARRRPFLALLFSWRPSMMASFTSTIRTSTPPASSSLAVQSPLLETVTEACFDWSMRRSETTRFRPVTHHALANDEEYNCDVLDGKSFDTFEQLSGTIQDVLQKRGRAFAVIENAQPWASMLPEIVEALAGSEALSFKGNASKLLRQKVDENEKKNIYRSTMLHPSITLPQHCEAAYHNAYPKSIAFYCRTNEVSKSDYQGATPVTELRRFHSHLPKESLQHFQSRGVSFRRYLPSPQNRIAKLVREVVGKHGLSSFVPISTWSEVFESNTRAELVEQIQATAGGSEITFLEDDSVIYTVQKAPSDPVFLSPLNFLRFCGRDEEEARQLLTLLEAMIEESGMEHSPSDLRDFMDLLGRYNCTIGWPFYADGTSIPEARLEEVRKAVDAATIRFPWKEGSMLVLDNSRAMHGREYYDPTETRVITTSFA